MENCLVTKLLKGSVDNDTLKKLGVLKCSVKVGIDGELSRGVIETTTNDYFITLLDDGVTFSSASGNSQVIDSKHGKLNTAYGSQLYVQGAESGSFINIEMKDKYAITKIKTSYFGYVNFEDLAYCLEIGILDVNSNKLVEGNLIYLQRLTKLTTLKCAYTNILGDISTLGALTLLSIVDFSSLKNNFTGTWDSFVAAQRSNGRTIESTGITITDLYNNRIPFGTNQRPQGNISENSILKWDASHITLQCDTSKKLWTIGYTPTEVNALIGTGGAFEGYTAELCD